MLLDRFAWHKLMLEWAQRFADCLGIVGIVLLQLQIKIRQPVELSNRTLYPSVQHTRRVTRARVRSMTMRHGHVVRKNPQPLIDEAVFRGPAEPCV